MELRVTARALQPRRMQAPRPEENAHSWHEPNPDSDWDIDMQPRAGDEAVTTSLVDRRLPPGRSGTGVRTLIGWGLDPWALISGALISGVVVYWVMVGSADAQS